MAIVLRSTKNAALTFVEMDGNFTDLNTRVTAIDSAYVQARVNPAASLDSAEALSLIDSAYIFWQRICNVFWLRFFRRN